MPAIRAKWLLTLAIVSTPSAAGDEARPVLISVSSLPVALVVDLSAGQTLFAQNPDRPFVPASMTKAMSALVAFDLLAAGKLDRNVTVTVDPTLAARWSGKGTSLFLRPREQVSVDSLIAGMITASANDATEVLAAHGLGTRDAWIAAMNRRAKSLGMTGSTFASPSGWPDGGRTKVTARDMVRLGRALIEEHPALYRRYFGHATIPWRGGALASRNPLVGRVVGADGIKTGHTSEAGYTFLGSAERDGRRILLVIGGVPSETLRAQTAKELIEWSYAAWDSRPLIAKGQIVGMAKVQNGSDRQVALAPLRPWRIALPHGARPRIATRIVYRGPLKAPIAAGQVVAGLEVSIDGLPAHDVPLAAVDAVKPASPIDRVVNGLLGLVS